MTNRFTVLALGLLLTLSCSSDGKNPAEGIPKALEVCKFAGEEACGLTDGGDDAVLLCEVTQEHGRVWTVKEACPGGCNAAVCEPLPQADGLLQDMVTEDEIEEDLPPPCEPKCKNKECGDDGCGGVCALCQPDHKCGDDFVCFLHCEPKCANKQCGDDGCEGSCGECPFNMSCQDGLCACKPQCEDKDCGPDGCGGNCGDCSFDFICSPFGKCQEICKPNCGGKECGKDGCGGLCGTCVPGLYCSPESVCTDICYPDCVGKQCGSDGCFSSCGFCPCPTCAPDQSECSPEGLCIVSVAGIGCNDLITCLNDCPTGNVDCQNTCFSSATPAAQNMYEDLIDCIVVQCGSSPSDACVQESLEALCQGQFLACIND